MPHSRLRTAAATVRSQKSMRSDRLDEALNGAEVLTWEAGVLDNDGVLKIGEEARGVARSQRAKP
jgi:hypothetical protein